MNRLKQDYENKKKDSRLAIIGIIVIITILVILAIC